MSITKRGRGRPKNTKTYVALVLDKSGSMWAKREAARNHFNEQLDLLKGSKGTNVFVTLCTFNHKLEYPYSSTPVQKLRRLKAEDYRPEGTTALYDAMMLTIERIEAEAELSDPKNAALFIVISDGEENASSDYPGDVGRRRLKEKIESLKETKQWTFVYLGAGEDLIATAKFLGVPQGNVAMFTNSAAGLAHASAATLSCMRGYMDMRYQGGVGSSCTDDFYRKK